MLNCWGGKFKSNYKDAVQIVAIRHGSDVLSSAPDRMERPATASQVHPQIEPDDHLTRGHDIRERCGKKREASDAKVDELFDRIHELEKTITSKDQAIKTTEEEKCRIITQMKYDYIKIHRLELEQELPSPGDVKSRQVREIQELKKANNYLLTRLSAVASANLTDGNANIADLSDENRPSKIAEKFSELYDNEWTDAFDVLTADNKRSEEDVILTLLKLLCVVYIKCSDKATTDLNEMTKAMKEFQGGLDPSKEILMQLKDKRKKTFRSQIHALKANLRSQVRTLLSDRKERKEQRMKVFLKKCLELCWLMAIQDPQVYIDTIKCSGELHDRNILRPYTKSGKYIDYIVWPALYLHENGNLLSKGIAQCKTEISVAVSSDSEQHTENVEAAESVAVTNTIGSVACTHEHYSNRSQESTDKFDVVNTDTNQSSTTTAKDQPDKHVGAIADISEDEGENMLSTVRTDDKEQPKTALSTAEAEKSVSDTTIIKTINDDNNDDNSLLSASKLITIHVVSNEKRTDSELDSSNVRRISNTNSEQLCSNPATNSEHTDVVKGKVSKPRSSATPKGKNKTKNSISKQVFATLGLIALVTLFMLESIAMREREEAMQNIMWNVQVSQAGET